MEYSSSKLKEFFAANVVRYAAEPSSCNVKFAPNIDMSTVEGWTAFCRAAASQACDAAAKLIGTSGANERTIGGICRAELHDLLGLSETGRFHHHPYSVPVHQNRLSVEGITLRGFQP